MASDPVRIGLDLDQQRTTVDELRAVWRLADEGGVDHLWVFDHLAAIAGDPADDVLEGWTLLGAMAEATRRVRVGCMVTGNTYRHPGVLAKMAVTVDHISGGRLELGLGAAWAELEHAMLGLPFGTVGERIDRLGEACRLLRALFREERASLDGRHYRLRDAVAFPKPVQRPGPPLWIGGAGERKTLRVVAEHADVWNAGGGRGPDEVARLSGVLDGHCAAIGRDPREIRRSVQIAYGGEEDLVRDAAAFAARGFTDLVVVIRPGRARADAEAVVGLLPRLRAPG